MQAPTLPPSPTPVPTATATTIPPTTIPPTPTPTLLSLHNTQNTQWLKSVHPALYREIQELPWVKDGLSETERETIDELLYIGAGDIANLKAVLGLTWVQDGISETEYNAIDYLSGLENKLEKAAASIIAMPWFQDGVTETEKDAVRGLSGVAYSNSDAAAALIAMPWFQDSITETEKDAVRGLSGIAGKNSDAAAALIAIPFLESLEYDDVLAIQGMRRLAHDGLLSVLIETPAWESGFTNADTTLVTAAGTLREAEEIKRMLNPGYADIETLSEGTELTPHLKISIVRTGTQPQPWTASGARDAVEFVERIMQLPLPVSHVIVVLNDKAITPKYGGTNYGFAFSWNSEDEQEQGAYDRYKFQLHFAHETAHYFWGSHADWIDEGVSDTFEYMYGAETGVSPGLLERTRRKDCEVHDLEMLTELNPDKQEDFDQFHCNYYLGQLLFLELLENLGSEEFKERLRELYRLSLAAKEADRTPGIAEVRQAFEGQSAIIEKHWSSKLNAPGNRPFDEGVYLRNHSLIQWEQYPTHNGSSVTFSGTLLGDAVLSKETMQQARKGGYQNFKLYYADESGYAGSILPPLDDNRSWNLDDPGDSVATEYRLDEDTFTVKFQFPKALGDPSDYVVIVCGFRDESRTPFIRENIDILGYARIRAE